MPTPLDRCTSGSTAPWRTADVSFAPHHFFRPRPSTPSPPGAPDSLREALLEDSWVREHVPETKRRRADSLEDLLELPYLKKLHFYSFYDWNAETGEVAMRIWLSEYTGKWTGSHSFVGLWVDPKPEFRQYFEAADQGRGLLMTASESPTF